MTTTTTDRIKHENLRAALIACAADIRNVPKNGTNNFHNYKYATDADITGACRPAMLRHGVLLTPIGIDDAGEIRVPVKNGEENYFRGIFVFRVSHADSDETFELRIPAGGQDKNEKGSYKAATGAKKYALMQLFLIETGDDPERDAPQKNRADEHASEEEIRAYGEKLERALVLRFRRVGPMTHEILGLKDPVRQFCDLTSDQIDRVITDLERRPTTALRDEFNRLTMQDLVLTDEQIVGYMKGTYNVDAYERLTGRQAADLNKLLMDVANNKAPMPEALRGKG